MPKTDAFSICVDAADTGKRLDVLVSSHITDCSRSEAAYHIRSGNIRIDGASKKAGYRVRIGDQIKGSIPPPEPVRFQPEPIPIDILYEDLHLIVVDKPSGLVVHPAPGHHSGTLVNGLLYHCPNIEGIGTKRRPGIVHRLDKDTSGALVAAKTGAVHHHLARQFKSRQIEKRYLALVIGEPTADSGTISLPIGRHPIDRKRMSTTSRKGRVAQTLWRVRKRIDGLALLELELKTGRTHQIRVHCAAIGHPILGDPVYGRRRVASQRISAARQMLHAWRLGFLHPDTGQWMRFESPIPGDMQNLMNALGMG